MKVKNLPKKIYLNICSNEDEVDYNELDGVTFSTEKVGVTDCGTENVPYVNAASLWHDLKEDKPPLKKWVMFRYSGGGVNPTALHYGAMSDDVGLSLEETEHSVLKFCMSATIRLSGLTLMN